MILNKREINRIYEVMKCLKEKVNIKDEDFNQALNKIEVLNNCKKNIVCLSEKTSKKGKGYSDLSEEACNFIARRKEEGYKNTYHSLMSVLGNKLLIYDTKESLINHKYNISHEYVKKYKIKESDQEVFDEIYDICFEKTLTKLI